MAHAAGDPDGTVAYLRSAAKPFQAIALVRSGAADRFGLSAADLALCCASHNGEERHIAGVAALLEKIGCRERDLACGAHPPLLAAAAAALDRRGESPTALHNNSSGKHAGMLALALHLGAPIKGYLQSDHPVQRQILADISRFTGVPVERIAQAIDGCGAPTFGTPVTGMALAFARLANPDVLREADRAAALRLRDAMIAEPYLVGGAESFDTAAMTNGAGRLVSKRGASGVQCVGVVAGWASRSRWRRDRRHPVRLPPSCARRFCSFGCSMRPARPRSADSPACRSAASSETSSGRPARCSSSSGVR